MSELTHPRNGLCCVYHTTQILQEVLNNSVVMKVHAFFLRLSAWCIQHLYNKEVAISVVNRIEPFKGANREFLDTIKRLIADVMSQEYFSIYTLHLGTSVLRGH